MSTLDEITKEKERIGEALARVACLAGKAGKHYCRSRRITPSVEKWRREHPHDTPPYPFMPSPTSANSSSWLRRLHTTSGGALSRIGGRERYSASRQLH